MKPRSLYIAAAALLAGLYSGCRMAPPSPTRAQRFVEAFPDTLDHAAAVRKVSVPGARYCLVHLRQVHYLPFHRVLEECRALSDRIPADAFYDTLRQAAQDLLKETRVRSGRAYRAIARCQEDIYHLALQLRDRWQIDSLRTEGLFMPVDRMEFRHEYQRRLAAVMQTGLFDSPQEARFVPGADLALAMERQLTVRDCDSFTAVQLADDPVARFDRREDHVLTIIANHTDPIVPVIYGGDHDFSDNIERWNRRRPRARFCLIEITPEGYPADTDGSL